jgi:uncharacterized protein
MTMTKPTVIYHSADYDGIFCREIARKFLPDAELIGWNFGDPILSVPKDRFYILDLPLLDPFGLMIEDGWIARNNPIMSKDERQVQPLDRLDWSHWIWIDHHKTSIEKYPKDVPGYRIDGVAACRLAWQWLSKRESLDLPDSWRREMMPCKQDYTDRKVIEPLSVRLAGEYDIWDKRDPRAETFQYGLRTRDLTPADWDDLLNLKVHSVVSSLLEDGEVAQRYAQKMDEDLVKHRSYRLDWEGLNFLVLNTGRFNSLTFAALDVPETGHDALMGYMFNGKIWTVSLYHAKHRADIDLSEIAKRHGGGGHRGACGFTCEKLPFFA